MTLHHRTHGYMEKFHMPINFAERGSGRHEVMRQRIGGYVDDGVRDMLDDVIAGEESEATAKSLLEILASSKKPLYTGAKLSQLDAISQLMAVKAEFGCS